MRSFFITTWQIIRDPAVFFDEERNAEVWKPYRYFLIVACILSLLSPLAWGLGVDGSSPLNTSLTAQRDVYRWWVQNFPDQTRGLSLPAAILMLLAEMHVVLLISTLTLHLVFRILGGRGPLSYAWKSICYGLAPVLLMGFLPVAGLVTGLYAMLIQLAIGPAALYQVKDGRAYVLLVIILSTSITLFWKGIAP